MVREFFRFNFTNFILISLGEIRSLRCRVGKFFEIKQKINIRENPCVEIVVQHLGEFMKKNFEFDSYSEVLRIENIYGLVEGKWTWERKRRFLEVSSSEYKLIDSLCKKFDAYLFSLEEKET